MTNYKNKLFYGWWVVLVAFLTIGITYGTKGAYGVIQLSMLEDLGWTRAEVAGAFSANMFVYAVVVLFMGKVMDKIGVKNILIIGGALTGLAYFLMPRVTSQLQFYLCYGVLLGVAGTCMGMVPGPTVVSRWFIKKRGRALAFTLVASPLGAAIFTLLAKDWLTTIGWKGTFNIMAYLSWILVIIPTLFFMKNWPKDMNLNPDGDAYLSETGSASLTVPEDEEEWTYKKIFKSPKAWALILTYFLFAGNGWAQQIHQVPHLIANGLTKDQAAGALAFNLFLSVASMLILPIVSDFFDRKKTLLIALICQIAGTIILMNAHTLPVTYLFVVIMGFSYMGSYGLFSGLTADLFGTKSLGTINGIMATSGSMGAAVAIYFGGSIYDISHSYHLLWGVCTGGLVLSTLFTIFLIHIVKNKENCEKTVQSAT